MRKDRKPPGEDWWGLTSEQAAMVALGEGVQVSAAAIRKWVERGLLTRNRFGRIDPGEFMGVLDSSCLVVSQ